MGKNKNKMIKQADEKTQDDEVNPDLAPKKKLSDKNLDEFLDDWDNDDEELGDDKAGNEGDEDSKEDGEENKDSEDEADESEDEADGSEDEADGSDSEGSIKGNLAKKSKTGAKDQKSYISSLKDKDPEFFKFLKENDEELLNFDESSDDEGGDDKSKGAHEIPDKLEVASDESDFEDDEQPNVEPSGQKKKLNKAQVEAWLETLTTQPSLSALTEVVEGFRAAVASIASPEKAGGDEEAPVKYIVEGGTLFNSVVRLCVVNLQPALSKILKLEGADTRPDKSKKWKKIEKTVRIYMMQLVTLLARVSDESVQCVLLKHTHAMLPFYQVFAKGGKLLMTRLISIWSRGGETARILAFMCLVKLVRGNQSTLLEPAVKAMYLGYVKNCKFTSPSTLQGISFMKRSLVEMMGLDHNLAYYQAFVYIRQLAIHLRNAITCSDKKDSLLAVYNWQFIHSLELWAALVGHTSGVSQALQPLIYPLVQVVIGTAKLVPTPKYYPLRFHCAKILRDISTSTGTFIPVLPLYLEILNTYNFGKKSKKASMKPLDCSCILKLSKSQLLESGFKDATIEEVYAGLLSYLADNSNKIGFPELITPMVFQLKEFLKKCKVSNYTRKIKQILEKAIANQKFIETRRKTVSFGVGDGQKIQVWEAQVVRDGTPLLSFYKNWKKVSDLTHAKKVSEQEKMDDYSHIPDLKKNHKKIRMKKEMAETEEVTGFLSGSDDDFDDEENFRLKEDRGKKREGDEDSSDKTEEPDVKKPKKAAPSVPEVEDSDIDDADDDEVEDLKLEDLDSDSDMEMNDDFELQPNGEAEAEDSDDESEESDDD